jgi:hypothetical protein
MGARPPKDTGLSVATLPRRADSSVGLNTSTGPVAQLVEQGTFNPKVAGSIPARPTSITPLGPSNPLPRGQLSVSLVLAQILAIAPSTVAAASLRDWI